MRHVPALATLLAASVLVPVVVNAQERGGPFEEALAAQRRREAALERIRAGDGATPRVNLGRTSLATVSASSVNGHRTLANPFYGIRNAFDGGTNVVNDITYSTWLGEPRDSGWIEIDLSPPVDVAGLVVRGPEYSVRLTCADGRQQHHTSEEGVVELERLARGVARVRIELVTATRPGPRSVEEVHLLGEIPPGVEYVVGLPRLRGDAGSARLIGLEAYVVWRSRQLRPDVGATVDDQDEAWVVTLRDGDTAVFEVTVSKGDGAVRSRPLAKWVPLSDE